MAGRIWVKIGRGTKDGWQSVLKQKKPFKKKVFFFKQVFFSLFVERGEREEAGREKG
jgi:hypothetical protein